MKPFTILHEHPDHFVIRNGKAQFKIAKSGISGETANKIRQFADGGQVDDQGNPISPRPSSDDAYMSKPFNSGTAVLDAFNPVKKANGGDIDDNGQLIPPNWSHPHPTQDEHPLSAEQYQSDMGSVKAAEAGIGPNHIRDYKADGGEIKRNPASINNPPNPDTYQATPLPQDQDKKEKPKKLEVNMDASDFDNLADGGTANKAYLNPDYDSNTVNVEDDAGTRQRLYPISTVQPQQGGSYDSMPNARPETPAGIDAPRKVYNLAKGGTLSYREPQKYNGDSSNPNDSVVQPSPTPEPFTPTTQDALNNINSAFSSRHGNPDNKAMGGQITNPAKVHSTAKEAQSEAIKRYADGNPATLSKGGHVHHNAGKNQLHFHFYDGAVVPTNLDRETGGGDIQQATPLDKYVKMADGGDTTDSAKLASAAQDAQQNLSDQNNMIQDAASSSDSSTPAATPAAVPSPTDATQDTSTNTVPSSQQISAVPKASPSSPDQQPNLLSDFDKSLAQEKSGIEQGAAAQTQGFKDIASAIGQNVLQQKAQADAYKIASDNLTNQNNQLFKSVASSKIDPNHFWNSKLTGGKIAATIGILLGGIGQGLGGGPNQALQVLQNHVQQDIEAQKNDQSNKMNLYKMGLERFHDAQSAQQFATLQSNALLQGQLQKVAAQTGSQQAGATAQQMIGQIGVQNASIRSELALKQAALSSMNGPQQQTGIDNNKLRLLVTAGVIPKEEVPTAMKEYGDYGKLQNVLDHTDQVFKTLGQNANYRQRISDAIPLGSHIPTITDASKNYEAVAKDFLGNITKDTEGRVTPTDVDLMRPSLPQPGDSPQVAATKINNLKDQIREKYSFPTLQSYKLLHANDALSTPSATRAKRFTEGPPK